MEDVQVIFLNGASSSGKTTLAKALQRRHARPYIFFAEDMFFDGWPEGDYAQEDFLRYGTRLCAGFAKCARTMIDCGNRLIVDTVAWNPGSLDVFVEALWDTRVLAVGVHCALDVLEDRERQRKNRSLGLARRQFERAHLDAEYDVELDTSRASLAECVERVAAAMENAAEPHAFARMKARRC